MTEHDSGNPGHEGIPGHGPGFAEEDDELVPPTELSAIQADDALLDALGGADPRGGDDLGDAELHALLLSWRRDVDSEPLPELVETPEAVTTVRTAVQARRYAGRGRRRLLVPVAAAAAVLAIGFTGTALAARDAQPGDTLWGLSKVLYSDHAASVEAAASVRTDLAEAHLAIAQRRYDDARSSLGQAEQALSDVVTEEDVARLRARHEELRAQLDEPAPQPPPAASSSDSTSSPGADDDTTSETGTAASSSEENDSELDETSSVPPTEPPTSTEPTESTSPTEETSSDDESSGESRDDTSSSGESDDLVPTS